MHKIIITGANSYIGTHVESWLNQDKTKFHIDTIDMIGEEWKHCDFSGADTVIHVAGIAHVSRDPSKADLYFQVNRDLTIDVAQKAKKDGVKQFIFMSSIIVYQDSQRIDGRIEINTEPKPGDFYGESKLQAEQGILKLQDKEFNITVLRPPMVYGVGSKGNFPRLVKLATKLPLFPNYTNKRSMIYIDNLCEFIKAVIDRNLSGIFYPQNSDYTNTSEVVQGLSKVKGHRIYMIKVFNPIIKLFIKRLSILNKVFGNLYYDQSMSDIGINYEVKSLKQSLDEYKDVGV